MDSPVLHPLAIEGVIDGESRENEMELFVVPPDPPRGRQKQGVNRGRPSADDAEGSGSRQRRKHTIDLDAAAAAAPDAAVPDAAAADAQAPEPKESTPRQLKSAAWKNFTKLTKDGADILKAQCNLCNNILSSASKNGTSHLLRHLLTQHKATQASVGNFFLKTDINDDGSPALRNNKFDIGKIRSAISMFLVGGSHPFTTVEEFGFRSMMADVCPMYKPIGHHTIKREIMALYESQKKELMDIIHTCPGRVSFTSDNWKSEITKHSYICITCHYIDGEWKLNKRIIWFKKIDPPYDGASIADEVHIALREWKVDSKVMCMTLDNAAYNDRMIDALRSHLLPKGGLPLFGLFFQIRCCAHVLNLIVQAGLKLIDAAVAKLREGIMYIRASGNRLHKFYSTADTIFNLVKTRRLKPDMPIRWNSTYVMLGSCIYFRDVLHWFAERDSIFKANFWLTHEEWNKIIDMHKFLEVFFTVTTVFSGTKYPTANLYFMNVYLVHQALLKAQPGINNFMAPMLLVMKLKFDKYWKDYSVFLSCAAVLDPRIKLKFLEYAYTKLYATDDAQRRLDEVRSTMVSLYNEYGGGVVHETAAAGSSSSAAFSDYDEFVQESSSHEEKSELDLYLAEPTKRLTEDIDILDFWSKSAARYPQLAKMARDVLAVPVSSVASESAFSLSKKVVTPSRSSLKPQTVEALMCVQDWFRCRMQQAEEKNKEAGAAAANLNHEDSSSDDGEYAE